MGNLAIILPSNCNVHLSSFVYNVDTGANVTALQVFFSDQINYPIFPPLKWFTLPRPFLEKNLFEMLISLQVPYGVCGKQPLLACCIDTCSKKPCIIQIKPLLRAIFKNWQLHLWALAKVAHEEETRRSRLNCLAVFLSCTKKANYERRSLWWS